MLYFNQINFCRRNICKFGVNLRKYIAWNFRIPAVAKSLNSDHSLFPTAIFLNLNQENLEMYLLNSLLYIINAKTTDDFLKSRGQTNCSTYQFQSSRINKIWVFAKVYSGKLLVFANSTKFSHFLAFLY